MPTLSPTDKDTANAHTPLQTDKDTTMSTLSLTEIANQEGTDKGTDGPAQAWQGHNYTDVYDAYLSRLRDESITLLEIGLGVDGPNWKANIAQGRNAQGGASMRMWYRYFSRARILGADVNPAEFLDNDRIRTGIVDQGDPEQLRGFLAQAGVERVDVIIDDGSHRPDHQQITLTTLLPYLVSGGMYFVEDLMSNGLGDGTADRFTAEHVLNTRRVLRAFVTEGVFAEPNALGDQGDQSAVGAAIDSIVFHCPRIAIVREPAQGLRRRRRRIRLVADEPALCAIRKTGSA
jgi:hypothetical protein